MQPANDISPDEGLRLALAELDLPQEGQPFDIQVLPRNTAGVVMVAVRLPGDELPITMTLLQALRTISAYGQPRLSHRLEGHPISPAVLAISGLAFADTDNAEEDYYRHIERKHA